MRRIVNGFEVLTDGRTVWVNSPEGVSVGRFGRSGVDVHVSASQQLATNGHCEDCFVRTESPNADWTRFAAGMLRVHGLAVPGDFKP